MKLSRSISRKGKIRLAFALVASVTVAVFTVEATLTARADALRNVDEKLVMAARGGVPAWRGVSR